MNRTPFTQTSSIITSMGSLRAVDEALPTAGDKRPRNEDESQVECIEEDQKGSRLVPVRRPASGER